MVEITTRASSGDALAALVPLAIAIVALTLTQVVWSLTSGTKILDHVKGADEGAAQLYERVERMETKQGQLGVIVQDLRDKLASAATYEVVADKREIWSTFVQNLLADAPKFDKEVELRKNDDGTYTAVARVDRIGTYVLERLLVAGGLNSWTVTLYTRVDDDRPFDRMSQEPAVRLVVMARVAQDIAGRAAIAIDPSKIKIVLCAGQKPDVATFIAFRHRDDGLFEKVLIEYARPLDPNRARQTADRATIVRCPLEIAEREREINERVANGQLVTLADIEEIVRPQLKDIVLFDPDNLPGLAFDDHFDLGQPNRIVLDNGPVPQPPKPVSKRQSN